GGGLAIVGPARADLGSGGYEGLPAVYFNNAGNGGGVAVTDVGSGEPVLRVFAKDSAHPTAIDSNTATTSGGGIFMSGHADTCLFALHMADNIAENGAAIYYDAQLPGTAQYATDSGIYINGGSPSRLGADCGPELVSDLGGSKDCRAYDPLCNTFLANATQHADATPAPGGVVTMQGGEIVANRFRVRNSVAGYAMYLVGSGAVSVSRCELTDNLASTNLVVGSGQLPSFHSCTIANNSIGNLFVFDFGFAVSVDLAYDIVDQPGKDTLYWGKHYGGSLSVDYVLTNSLAGLPQNDPSDIQGLPTFVDAANGDYHLAPVAQVALDFGGGAGTTDLDGNLPFADLPTIPNYLGPADLGAYERQNLFYDCGSRDSVFCDGFGH
ncbi:MAG TPA: hypothetical protein VLB69_10720, partial [Rudaea sp.]|nr:hypothetical protein [Rudaea sp.]